MAVSDRCRRIGDIRRTLRGDREGEACGNDHARRGCCSIRQDLGVAASARPRIGVLVPSTDTTVEEDLPRLLGDRASVHFTRMSLPAVTPIGLAHMENSARAAVAMLADMRPDVVLFACTSGSFFQGAEHERALAADLESIARAPVVTTARAMVEALARRGDRVRLRTPYTDELTSLEVAYLEHAGLTVTSSAGLGIVDDLEIAAIAPDALRALVTGDDGADVVMLSCTNVRALGVLPMLRDAAGLEVVTSNTASAEAVVRALESAAC